MGISVFDNAGSRPRGSSSEDFSRSEVGLSNRNSGMALELMRHDITPIGMHYLLTHFDIPHLPEHTFRLSIGGCVGQDLSYSLEDLKKRKQVTMAVTMECAGNGRALHQDRSRSQPWHCEAVGTSEWTGTPLLSILEEAGLQSETVEIAFLGADRGFDKGHEHEFGRSLTLDQVQALDALLVYEMNGLPLLPQHGAPLRLIVPGWYGMASVKWLNRIEALDQPYTGFQQVETYRYRNYIDDSGRPVTDIRVKSLMVPPGIPDWFSRERMVERGLVTIEGRAWSGAGLSIKRVEFSADGENWQQAEVRAANSRYAWSGWSCEWNAEPGEYQLMCRATDAEGNVQPLEPPWDVSGFGNNAVQKVKVTVR